MMWNQALWIGLPEAEIQRCGILHGDMTGRFALFRHSFSVDDCRGIHIEVSANTRYRLWLNGKALGSGPLKGDRYRHYSESYDLSGLLQPGTNVLAAQVLYQDPDAVVFQTDSRASIYSVCGVGGGHRFALEDDAGGFLTTGIADWKVRLEDSYYLHNDKPSEYLGAVCETIDCRQSVAGWKLPDYDDSAWDTALPLDSVLPDAFMQAVGLIKRLPMLPRPIPMLYEEEATFSVSNRKTSSDGMILTLDAGEEVNAFPRFELSGKAGTAVSITYFEKFTGKDVRSKWDMEQGEIEGITDTVILGEASFVFEPFWVRSFRFVSITAEDPETIIRASFRKTGYPLELAVQLHSSEPWVQAVWDMCVRTLKNCMTETYMDCPYYEQNQFPMDTRLEALFCACVSRDTRLTMKALEDFHCSMLPDGLIQGRYPSVYPQVISTFSLHYIMMLREVYDLTGDMVPLRRYLPDADRILAYYEEKIGADGLVGNPGFWPFVDWQDAWAKAAGVPEALLHGPSTIINLMFAYALEQAAVLNEAAGRPSLAEEYRDKRAVLLAEILRSCWSEERGMLREGPSFEQYSQHAQSWAVLNGLLKGDVARQALKAAMSDVDVLSCSFPTSFEWFRALELAGMYDESLRYMERWAELARLGSTTCPETPGESRSECHAWSALPIYEFVCAIVGVRHREGKALIRPSLSYLHDLAGSVWLPDGEMCFHYRREGDMNHYRIDLSDGVRAVFSDRSGSETEIVGRYEYCEKVDYMK